MLNLSASQNPTRTSLKQPRLRRPPSKRDPVIRTSKSGSAGSSAGEGSERNGLEILVAIKSQVVGANLKNVCLVVGGVPHMPSGTAVVRPGETTAMIELSPDVAGVKAAVYFELGMGELRVPLVSDQLFDFAPGAVCVLTINDHTRAHNAPIEIEGAVVRLTREREPSPGK